MTRSVQSYNGGCAQCLREGCLDFDFTMAFQPIVNVATGDIFAHEALVRGIGGEPASSVFQHVNAGNQYLFDQTCRTKAIELASQLIDRAHLSINFMPLAVYRPELCIRSTLAAAKKFDFPHERIIFEFTEAERIEDIGHIRGIVDYYRKVGFGLAIDDFGAGYAGLNLLAELQPDIVKLDMGLIRNVDQDRRRRTIVKSAVQMCDDLSIQVLAEGVETSGEFDSLSDLGIELFQGYYFARPAFRTVADVPLDRRTRPSFEHCAA